ncbi:MAG: dipeptidyl-peptidase-4 [Phycisphaerales bacterium]|jgi:dipeptidyl-peptidase-4
MNNRFRVAVLGLTVCVGLAHAFQAEPDPQPADQPIDQPVEQAEPVEVLPLTEAEVSGFVRTSTYDQVIAFIDELVEANDRVTLSEMGTTNEGRSIPMMIVADPPVESAEDVGKRTAVLLFGNIHAGEVCGKEALLMLARDLAIAEDKGVLKDLVVLIAPIYNADGNERFGPDNRRGQRGPEEMGERANAQGLDLNRDYVKLESPEARGMLGVLNEWDPAVIVDTHTTNGSLHRYTITYQGPKHPATDPELLAYVRDTMLPAVDQDFEERTDYNAFWYGNFANDHTEWATYPDGPRYGTAYRGLRNRVAILSEAYAYASFEDRVEGTYSFCESVLGYTAENNGEISELIQGADRRTREAGRDPSEDDTIAVRTEVRAFDEPVTVLGYEEATDDEGRRVAGEPRDYEVSLINDFVATEEVRRPYAYVFGSGLWWLAEQLQRHGIEVEVLREDLTVEVESYRIGQVDRADREFEGHAMVRDIEVFEAHGDRAIEPGSYVVRTAQPLGTLAAYLLEPRSSDGLAAWNFFDSSLTPGGEFPVLRVVERLPMTLRGAPDHLADPEPKRRLTYENIYGDDRVSLSGSPIGRVRWIDEEHFVQRKDGELRLVEARTGSSVMADRDTSAVAEVLAMLPTIDEDEAKKLADRNFASAGNDDHGRVFGHSGDLYYCNLDGTGAIRLTASPKNETLQELSPDGTFVAFVRDNDLWAVDVQTATERQLTTGGTENLRNGRNSWVYYEELYGRSWKAYWWSADGKHLAFFKTDQSMVPEYTLVDNQDRAQGIAIDRYPRPGEPNPTVEVGIVGRAGGAVRWVDLSGYDKGNYLVSWVGWSEETGRLRLAVQNRIQSWMDVLEVGPRGGAATKLMREQTEAWVTPEGNPIELADGSFLLASVRDGWRHLYHFEKDGTLRGRVTEGDWDVKRVHHFDEDNSTVYFEGTVDSYIARNLYRIGLDGTGLERLTTEDGSHSIRMSPEGSLYTDSWSSITEPTKTGLFDRDGTLVRMLDTNPVYELEDWELGRVELVKVPSDKGVDLEAMVVYPVDFDPEKLYPVWFKTYGGPEAPTVWDSWGGGRLTDRMMAEQGVIMFRGDPYPASAKGARSAWTVYKQLGVREFEDVGELIAWITSNPWADARRVGMSGHSFGGYLTAYAMTHSDIFSAGIAGAPPTDWRDYDTIYTERYMDTPQNNPDGYSRTSVTEAAGDLEGRLMLLHGMIDDNVHPQNSVMLIDALVKAEKQFDQFLYPGRRHGIWGGHYNRIIHDFMLTHMLKDLGPEEPERAMPDSSSESDAIEVESTITPAEDPAGASAGG